MPDDHPERFHLGHAHPAAGIASAPPYRVRGSVRVLAETRGSTESEAGGEGGRFTAIGRSQLADDVGDVKLDRARADVELLSDLGVREALAEKVQHFPLARGEIANERCLNWRSTDRGGDRRGRLCGDGRAYEPPGDPGLIDIARR